MAKGSGYKFFLHCHQNSKNQFKVIPYSDIIVKEIPLREYLVDMYQ